MSEKSTVALSPGSACGEIAKPSEYDFALLGSSFGLLPSSPLIWSPAMPNTDCTTPGPTSRVSVGPFKAKSVGAVNDFA